MIAIDTNVLEGLSFPSDSALSMLEALARQTSHTVVLPEVVLNEYLSHRRRRLGDADREVRKAVKGLLGQSPWWPSRDRLMNLPKYPLDETVASIEQELRKRFHVLALDGGSAIEALRREAYREAPTKTDGDAGGARDAAIWLSVLTWCKEHPTELVYLVSDDRVFGRKELDDERPAKLRLCEGIAAILSDLANPSQRPIDVGQLCSSALVQAVVGDAVVAVQPFVEIANSIPEMVAATLGWWGPESLELVKLLTVGRVQHHAYEIDNELWVSAVARWRPTVTFSAYKPRRRGWKVKFETDTSLIVRCDDAGHADAANVTHTGPVTILGIEQQ